MKTSKLSCILGTIATVVIVTYAGAAGLTGSLALEAGALAQTGGQVPGNTLGVASDSDLWRAVRKGMTGTVSLPDKKAAVLVQAEGEEWRAFRTGTLTAFGGWLLLAAVVILAVFFAVRGRIRVDHGFSGRTVERFNALERFSHWLTAGSFVVLALTGLNILYGKHVLMPIVGQEFFAALTQWGKYAHNYIAFAFMVGVVLMIVLWIKDNLPTKADFQWLAKGGGLFAIGSHPPAHKFNAGQKLIFWAVVLGGASLSITGLALMFPFEINPWSATFAVFNLVGFDLPTDLMPLQEAQLSQVWHAILGLVMIAVILAHIYIGTLGMEGAFSAVSTGQVDENWAREHHSLWVEELEREAPSGGVGGPQPAE